MFPISCNKLHATIHSGGQINTTKGSYVVTVNPVLTTKKAAPSLTLQVEMGRSYNRSVNASCACGTLAKLGRGLGNVFSDVTRVWYLQGSLWKKHC